jgi:hypothetical protein
MSDTGHTQDAAAARSASHHTPMNPKPSPSVLFHTLAKMLPLHSYQSQVYHMAQRHPVGFEDGFTPIWEVATCVLPARQTTQLRINFQREFHLLAMMGSSSAAGGFRAQLYDMKKRYCTWADVDRRIVGAPNDRPGVRLAGRGVNIANYFGTGSDPFFLRSPHPFTEPNAQALVVIQNQDTGGASNNIQVALYGLARRFNWPD